MELTQGDGCGEAFVWAATSEGDLAVVVSLRANLRSKEKTTTVPFEVPDDLVTVQVLRGKDLTRNFCTDLISTASQPTSEHDATAGTGEIVLAPAQAEGTFGCGSSDQDPNGTLRLTGLVAEDGTAFAPIDVETASIGCYSG